VVPGGDLVGFPSQGLLDWFPFCSETDGQKC
jgi:hypothetical protein